MKNDANRYVVRVTRDPDDIAAAQRLRYRVFVEEMGARAAGADHARRLEKDRFDAVFDHLILEDRQAAPDDPLDRVVGAYRLLPADRAEEAGGFYSAEEYDLSPLAKLGRPAVELGRSCVAAEHRGGLAMHFMWNALAEYVLERGIEIMFGVASFHGNDADGCAQALSFLHQNHLAPPDLRVSARPGSRIEMDRLEPQDIDRATALAQTPSLIKAYLRLGGFVGDGAWMDRDFNTIDVCLLMDTTRMTARYRDYYTRAAS